MRAAPRSTRRTTAAAQLSLCKENKANLGGPRDNFKTTAATSGNKKARHRVSTAELARLEDMFRRNTHPPRQQKKDLAAELGMDYKTVTIWFQNKRQTSKRGQPPPGPVVERLVKSPPSLPAGRTATKTTMTAMETVIATAAHADAASCLRSVSSPSHNATLDAFECAIDPTAPNVQRQRQVHIPQAPAPAPAPAPTPASVPAPSSGQAEDERPNVTTSRAIVRIRPLLDSLDKLTPRSRERSGMPVEDGEATPNSGMENVDRRSPTLLPQTASENVAGSIEVNSNKRTDERGRDKGKDKEIKSVRWKKMRTLEWACERQAKRRKLSRERFVRSESDEPSDDGDSSNNARMDSALSLLSLASTTAQTGPSTDVMKGVLLLLSFKHSWHRK